MPNRVCFQDTAHDLSLVQHGVEKFTVTYFKHVKTGLDYADAATELGRCLMHALTCDGKLDNRDKGEKKYRW